MICLTICQHLTLACQSIWLFQETMPDFALNAANRRLPDTLTRTCYLSGTRTAIRLNQLGAYGRLGDWDDGPSVNTATQQTTAIRQFIVHWRVVCRLVSRLVSDSFAGHLSNFLLLPFCTLFLSLPTTRWANLIKRKHKQNWTILENQNKYNNSDGKGTKNRKTSIAINAVLSLKKHG